MNLDLLPVWGDEQFTLDITAMSWTEIPGRLASDIHPPLYYFGAKLWLGLPLPGDPISRLRGFSLAGLLAASVLFWALWLRRQPARVAALAGVLWIVSPLLVLYARMGRSYSWQMAGAVLAAWAASRWLATPSLRRAVGCGAAVLLCLYIHYLPGVAFCVAMAFTWAVRAFGGQTVPWRQVAVCAAVIVAGYLPWLGVLQSALGRVAENEPHYFAQPLELEMLLRLGYSAFAFLAGETPSWWASPAVLVAAPLATWLAGRGATGERSKPWPWLAVVAATTAFVGASAWVAFAFVPGRLLFVMPFGLLLIACGAPHHPRLALALISLLVPVQLLSIANYYQRDDFLNPGYLLDMEPLAAEVTEVGVPRLVVVDGYNLDPLALLARLPADAQVLLMRGDLWRRALAAQPAGVHIFALRPTRDISPDGAHAWIDEYLANRCDPRIKKLAPLSPALLTAASLFRPTPLAPHRYEWIRCRLGP